MAYSFDPDALIQYGVSQEDLIPATDTQKSSMDTMREPVTYWRDAMRRFKRNKLALFMLALLTVIILSAILGPILSPYTYKGQSTDVRQGPSLAHPLGTDKLGRDIFVRLMFGTRISLLVGFVTMVLVGLIGIAYGGIAAYAGGLWDDLMMRFVDLMMTIPSMLIIIILSVVAREPMKALLANERFRAFASLGPGLISVFLVLALFNWLGLARAVRGALITNRRQEYVLVAEGMGASSKWIIVKHLLPNSIGVIIINLTAIIPGAIMTESFLSFIGLGVAAPVPSLGSMASDALNGIVSFPQNMIYPAALVSLIIMSFNVIGDALRDALDPKMRK
ncbi:MAG: ABC transporter permease [Clostridia bacterium]|nr:ABC transporter permease [Clostridia bacterium]